eukprot:scaffold237306_cov28-Tisochrysis_lutea.AAC.1
MVFCHVTTSWIGTSTPRSPRATMSPSDSAMMASRLSRASVDSIFEMMSGGGEDGSDAYLAWHSAMWARIARTPSALRTKEAATASMSCSMPKRMSSLSFSDRGGSSDLADDIAIRHHFCDTQRDEAVIEENNCSGRHLVCHERIADVQRLLIGGAVECRIRGQCDKPACLERDLRLATARFADSKAAHPDLGTFRVEHHRHELTASCRAQICPAQVELLGRGVRKVDAHHIDPFIHASLKQLSLLGGGTNCGDNLG